MTHASQPLHAHGANASDYEEYGYDPNGNMTSKRLRSGETIAFTYDVLNRETVKDIPGGTSADVYSGYDLLGRKLFAKFVSTSGDGVVYTYDALARILSETSYGRALTFQYDLASNRTRITHPDSNYIQTTYDVLNRAQEVRENGATSGAGLLAVYAYDNLQRHTSVTFGNGTAETFAYDTDSRDWSLTQNLASASQDVTLAFTLSPAPQILTRDLSNSAYGYTPPTLAKSYTANGLNQYTEVGGATFTNDARGNLTSDGSRTFAYDLENHLTSVGGSASMTLAYDPVGRLRETVVGSSTTQYLYQGDRLVAEYDGSNTLLRRYAHGSGVDEPLVWYEGSSLTDRRTHHADNQGSIIATSNDSGAGAIQTYGPYGEPSSWSGSRFKYTGQIAIPEIALYYYKARVYDPTLGRFLQTDPVGYHDPSNLYAYVENDAPNRADSTGQISERLTGDADFCAGIRFFCSNAVSGELQEETAAQAVFRPRGTRRRGPGGRELTNAEQSRIDLYEYHFRTILRYDPGYAEWRGPGWVPTERDVARIGELAQRYEYTSRFFSQRGISIEPHGLSSIINRPTRNVNVGTVLDAYNYGRIFYDPMNRTYVRRDSRTGVYVVVTSPNGGSIITAAEGTIRPRWNPVRYR